LISQVDDALRDRRSVFHIAEPVVRLYQLVIARNEASLVAGRAERIWADNVDTVAAKIYGPHFEELARAWCFEYASEQTLAGHASAVRPTEIACREHRNGHELEVVVLQTMPYGPDSVIAVGEAKGGNTPMDLPHLERLDHVRGLIPADRMRAMPKVLLFGRSGFTDRLRAMADGRSDVELVDLARLYHGT
jgi:hypothetical protein